VVASVVPVDVGSVVVEVGVSLVPVVVPVVGASPVPVVSPLLSPVAPALVSLASLLLASLVAPESVACAGAPEHATSANHHDHPARLCREYIRNMVSDAAAAVNEPP